MEKQRLMTNKTALKIANYLSVIAGAKVDPGNLSYADIQRIVQSGQAEKLFTVGDQIVTTYTATDGTQYEMPFDIVNMQDVTLADGQIVPGMIIQSHYATVEAIQFDAAEPDNTLSTSGTVDSNVANYGYNRWSECGVRAWLNSKATKGNWWGTTFERNGSNVTRRSADVAPSQLNIYNGFMAGLPDDFLSILKPIQITTVCNNVTDGGVTDTTSDTFFLPSLENMAIRPLTTAGSEGGVWEYWKQRNGTSARPIHESFNRGIIYALNNHSLAIGVIVRSSTIVEADHVRVIQSTGAVWSAYVKLTGDNLFNIPCACIC